MSKPRDFFAEAHRVLRFGGDIRTAYDFGDSASKASGGGFLAAFPAVYILLYVVCPLIILFLDISENTDFAANRLSNIFLLLYNKLYWTTTNVRSTGTRFSGDSLTEAVFRSV